MNKYETVEDAKLKLTVEIDHALTKRGVWEVTTCPKMGTAYGWDPMVHHAMEWFTRHTPDGWNINKDFRHECVYWTVTVK